MKRTLTKLKPIFALIAPVAVPLVLGLLLGYLGTTTILPHFTDIGKVKAQKALEDYLKLVQLDKEASVSGVTDDKDLYKLKLNVRGQEYESYLTRDGRLLFTGGINLKEAQKQPAPAGQTQTPQEVTKSDKPVVELFVMSHCPFGTQIEKGILPVLDTLKDKISFSLKFVNYAMHGEKELKEQLNQYCINKETPDKFQAYLKCFLEDGNTERCIGATGLNQWQINNCTAAADTEFKITANFNDKATYKGTFPPFAIYEADNAKYNVQGSPTLVINGGEASAARDPRSLLATICGAFNNAPSECSAQLSDATPAAGFGTGTTTATGTDAAQCN